MQEPINVTSIFSTEKHIVLSDLCVLLNQESYQLLQLNSNSDSQINILHVNIYTIANILPFGRFSHYRNPKNLTCSSIKTAELKPKQQRK